jgi:hypothetical protein
LRWLTDEAGIASRDPSRVDPLSSFERNLTVNQEQVARPHDFCDRHSADDDLAAAVAYLPCGSRTPMLPYAIGWILGDTRGLDFKS